MDTTYYTLNTRRVKVSGGADLVTFVPVACPASQGEKKAGQILDFDLCRKRMETKTAWKELSRTASEAPQVEEPREEPLPVEPRLRRRPTAGWLELGATAAVILAGLAAAIAFLATL